MRAAAAPLAVLVAVAGCAFAARLADAPLAQLARWRDAAPEAIAAEPVIAPCPRENPACARLHALRAEACLARALAGRAPGAACPASRATPLLDCAAEGYAAALAADAPDAPALRAGLAQSLLCRAEFGASARAALGAAAAADAARGAPLELAALHGARAALLLARLAADSSERCAAAQRALGLSSQASAEHRARLRADALLQLRTCEASR